MSRFLPDHVLRLMDKKDRPKGPCGQLRSEITAAQEVKSEKQLQNQLEDWLRLKGVVVIRQRMDRKSNTVCGLPDLCFVFCGIPFALEAKIKGKSATKEQAEMMQRMTLNGWKCAVVHDLKEMIERLELYGVKGIYE